VVRVSGKAVGGVGGALGMTDLIDAKTKAQMELQSIHLPLGTYRHYKGGLYVVLTMSLSEDTLLPLVHYYSIDRKTFWTRTYTDFTRRVSEDTERFTFVRCDRAHMDQMMMAIVLGMDRSQP
jgi:hypothetical protein